MTGYTVIIVLLLMFADYVLGDVKFGGNAQAITKDRWVHHTSFLWGFNPERMALLKHPAKKPAYRQVFYTITTTLIPVCPGSLGFRV